MTNLRTVESGAVRELFVWTPPDLSSVTSGTSWEAAACALWW